MEDYAFEGMAEQHDFRSVFECIHVMDGGACQVDVGYGMIIFAVMWVFLGSLGKVGGGWALMETMDEIFRRFDRDGYVILERFMEEDEVLEIERVYDELVSGRRVSPVELRRDFCDMSKGYSVAMPEFAMVNVMLPTKYASEWSGNEFEKKAEEVEKAWFARNGGRCVKDYDQLLAKKPGRSGAVFAWHQDLGYWPVGAPDDRTMTFSLALDDADEENGCLKVVPGSHREPKLRPHRPAFSEDRDTGHTLVAEVDEEGRDQVQFLRVRRGDVTIHNERIVHGSGANQSASRWRRTYVVAFRAEETVEYERSIGFTHSHNDAVNWKTHLALNEERDLR